MVVIGGSHMYDILYKDQIAFKIDTKNGKVFFLNEKYLPFDIYLEESDDFDDRVNNRVNFTSWCAGRILNLDRDYAKDILNFYGFSQNLTDSQRSSIAICTRCLSLNDCYWLRDEKENLTWRDVNLFQNSLKNAISELSLFGKSPTITNSSLIDPTDNPDLCTDGTAPKAWIRTEDGFYLLKGDKNDSVKREVEASKILTLLGISNIGYEYGYFKEDIVSSCKCFTSENINFARAEMFQIWCMNNDQDISDYIFKYKNEFDKMNLADYLIGNSDEHSQNWGFLYDNNRNILGLNPRMDYDHAFLASPNSPCLPQMFLGIRQNQEDTARQIIKDHPNWIDFSADLSDFKYGNFVKERLKVLQKEIVNVKTEDIDSHEEPDI